MKKTYLLEIEKNSNIGLYICLNDKICLVPKNIDEKIFKRLEEITQVEVYKININNSNLLGVYLCLSDEILLAPENIIDNEKKELEKICKKHNIKLIFVKSNINALGNTICSCDNEIILSNDFSKNEIKQIENKTKKKVIILKSKNFPNFGGILKYYNKKIFASQDIEEEDFKTLKKKIKGIGTVNKGSGFVSSGILVNKNCLIIGSLSSPVEITNITEWAN